MITVQNCNHELVINVVDCTPWGLPSGAVYCMLESGNVFVKGNCQIIRSSCIIEACSFISVADLYIEREMAALFSIL